MPKSTRKSPSLVLKKHKSNVRKTHMRKSKSPMRKSPLRKSKSPIRKSPLRKSPIRKSPLRKRKHSAKKPKVILRFSEYDLSEDDKEDLKSLLPNLKGPSLNGIRINTRKTPEKLAKCKEILINAIKDGNDINTLFLILDSLNTSSLEINDVSINVYMMDYVPFIKYLPVEDQDFIAQYYNQNIYKSDIPSYLAHVITSQNKILTSVKIANETHQIIDPEEVPKVVTILILLNESHDRIRTILRKYMEKQVQFINSLSLN